MQRREAFIGIAGVAGLLAGASTGVTRASEPAPELGKPLRPPKQRPINVGLVIGPELVPIDAFGPAAAFDIVMGDDMKLMDSFDVYSIAATTSPLDIGWMKVTPSYSFDDAPQPDVLVVPKQKILEETVSYVKAASLRADVTMSVCTGAFLVAKAGLFDGLKATTHHDAYDDFARMFPHVELIRGPRFVENPNVSSSGGEASGIDLAFRVVERYYGARVAREAAYGMEYRRTRRPQTAYDV